MQRLLFRTQFGNPNSGAGAAFHWKGKVWASSPGDNLNKCGPGGKAPGGGDSSTRHGALLFNYVGFSIRHLLPIPGDSDKILYAAREIVLYTDLKTGQVIYEWENPFTGQTVPVTPIGNEWMFNLLPAKKWAPWMSALDIPGENYILGGNAAFPSYYFPDLFDFSDPLNVRNGYYAACEAMNFYVPKHWEGYARYELGSGPEPAGYNANWLPMVNFDWMRFGPWPPFMAMGEESHIGSIVYVGVGTIAAKYDDIPPDVQDKMTDYFIVHKGQGLAGISLDEWQRPPSYEEYVAWQAKYPGRTKADTGWSVFYEKVLAPLGMTYKQWCQQQQPPLP